MKILFHANRFPYPPFRGDKLKIYNLAKQLSKDHELHLLTFLEDEQDKQYIDKLQEIFTAVYLVPLPKSKVYRNSIKTLFSSKPVQVGYFESEAMQHKIAQLVATQQYDAVHIQHIRLAQFWMSYPDIPRILDLPDAFSLYWKRRIDNTSGINKLFASLEYKRLKTYEQHIRTFPLALVCSREDKEYLETVQHLDNVALLPNGVDTATFHNDPDVYPDNRTILFTGNMDYAPNVDGVCYFAEEIYPLIKAQLPDVRFIIAGQRPVEKVKALASSDITITGFIPNLADIYKEATLVVSPLRFGAGTQNKVLEAMSMGIAVVSMDVGFEGLDIRQGQGVFRATTAADFADRCVYLLLHPEERIACGKEGREVIRERYAWEQIAARLEQYFNEVIHNNRQ